MLELTPKIYYDQKLQNLKSRVKKIRENALENLYEYLNLAIKNLEKNGINVYLVKNSKEAQKILSDLIDEDVILKSKSNVIEELNLKYYLRNNGIKVVETDLGDFIADLLGKRSSHPVIPLCNISYQEVKNAIESFFKKRINKPEEIAWAVRDYISNLLKKYKIGITGCNAFSTEGSIFILENEGNISLISRLRKHIVITSIEKVNKMNEDCLTVCKAQALFSLYAYPTYINVISGPSKTGDIPGKIIKGMYGSKEVHMIIVDNGRSEIYNSEFREILKCIGCGACYNVCPVFNSDPRYLGKKSIINFFSKKELNHEIFESLYKCIGCKACNIICPAGIDLVSLYRKLKAKFVESGIETKINREMISNMKKYGNPVGGKESIKNIRPFCC